MEFRMYQPNKHGHYIIDVNKPIEISIPFGSDGPNCFYAPPFETIPYKDGSFIGDTREGSPVNFYNVRLNPHGNGTHTECVGHIAKERVYIKDFLLPPFMTAKLISIYPKQIDNGDRVITADLLKEAMWHFEHEDALIVRTLPNDYTKLKRNYSGANPPYFSEDAMKYIVDLGIKHLLTDLPSVDREEDEGKLLAHKAFWNYPNEIDMNKTITELAFIPNQVKDKSYLLNIQFPAFVLDAAPSRLMLYECWFES